MQLKNYLLEKDPDVAKKILYVCAYCRPILNQNNIPGCCVLNGLYTDPVPKELSNLNVLENQFIQRAKCFQYEYEHLGSKNGIILLSGL